MGKRLALDEVGDIAGFRLRLFEKSRSYGHIVKEVSDHNAGSVRRADLFEVELDGHVFRKPVQDLIGGTNAGQGISGLGDHLDLGDSRDTGERFSAKAQADKPRQIAVVPDLAGRMALKGLSDLVLFNAAPVVRDADHLLSALADLAGDGRRAGVNGIFNELLDYVDRPLNHLSGRYFVDRLFTE